LYRWKFLLFSVLACGVLCLEAQTKTEQADVFPQPSAELDKHLPQWLQFTGSYRSRIEDQDGIGFKNVSDTHVLGQLLLGVRIQPSSWLTFFGQAQDSRIYLDGPVAKAPPYQNTWDVHQAWIQLGGKEQFHFTFRLGRQELNFGDQRLVGASPWLNAPRVFDAALATFYLPGGQIDAFSSSVVNSVEGQMDHHKQGNPFHGVYGSFTKLVPKAAVEPYFFWRLAPAGYAAVYASGIKGQLDEKTVGFRWAGKLPARFDYGVEMARQFGALGAGSIGAWAGHWGAGRAFDVKLKPRALLEYNYASGTGNPTGSRIGTFDQLYPTGHDKFGLTDQVGWRNIRDLRTGVEFKPTRKLAFSGIYHDLWLANAHDGLYSSTGALAAKSLAGAAGTHVGQELDASGIYKWNKAVQFGAGIGHIFPGEFLRKATPGKSYTFPYVMAAYAF
jgi:Alginate export